MKNLTLLNDNTNIKLNDTGTVIQFKASNEGQPVGLSHGQSAIFRIKNEFGFLKSVNANTTYGGYVFELDTEDLSGLVPDTYQVELLVQVDSDNALIFPDKGFVQFTINANALNITGEQLPVMSLEDFKDELKTYVTNKTTQATTNIKNDFDTYVDNLTDSTVATATKASQDATTAINTANTAKNTADTAKSTADTAKSTADSATTKANNAQSTADTANNKTTANASLITANNTLINNVAQGGAINYLKNSDFIFGSNNWTLDSWNLDTTNLYMGHPIVTISKTGLNSDAWNGFTSSQFIPVVPGQRVSFGGWAKISDGDQTGFRIELNGYKDTSSWRIWNVDTYNFSGTKDWQRLVYEGATIPDGVNYIRLCPTLQRNGNVSATLFSICLNDKIQPWVMSFNDFTQA